MAIQNSQPKFPNGNCQFCSVCAHAQTSRGFKRGIPRRIGFPVRIQNIWMGLAYKNVHPKSHRLIDDVDWKTTIEGIRNDGQPLHMYFVSDIQSLAWTLLPLPHAILDCS